MQLASKWQLCVSDVHSSISIKKECLKDHKCEENKKPDGRPNNPQECHGTKKKVKFSFKCVKVGTNLEETPMFNVKQYLELP